MFRLHYCKSRMAAFINGELPPAARRRVARYMDECPACYEEYLRQKALHQELTSTLPTFGQPSTAQLDRIWSAVQQDVFTPSRRRPVYRMRYGLATLALMLALAIPLFLGEGSVRQAAATPPTPARVVSAATTSAPAATSPVATATGTDDQHMMVIEPEAAPQRTPEADS